MAEQPKAVAQEFGTESPDGSKRLPDAAFDLPLFHFGLRQLLFFIAAVSMLLAALVSLPGIRALALLLAALVISLHVFGTALGNRLRRQAIRAPANDPASTSPSPTNAAVMESPGPLTLRDRPIPWYGRSASFTWLPRLVAMSMLLGGCAGAVILAVTSGHRTSPAGLVVGAVSVAALSGWFAFLAGSFIAIVRGGLSEAVSEHDVEAAGQNVTR